MLINSNIIHTYTHIHSPGFCKSLGTFGIDNVIILSVLCSFSSRKQAIIRMES